MTSGEESTWPDYFCKLQAYLQWQTGQIAELQRTVAALRNELAAVKEQKGVRIDRIEYSFDQLKVERLEGTLNIGMTPSGLQSVEEFSVNGQTTTIGAKDGPAVDAGPFPETGDGPGRQAVGIAQPGVGQPGTGGAAGGSAWQPGAPGGGNPFAKPGPYSPLDPKAMAPNVSINPPNYASPGYRDESVGTNWVEEIGNQIKGYLDVDVARDLERWVEQHKLPLDPEAQRLVLNDIRSQLDDRVRHYARETGNHAASGQSFDSVAHEIIERTKRDIRTAIDMYMTGISSAEEENR